MKKFAVIGHPIAHSRSPDIHAAFARQFGIDLSYERVLAPLDNFAGCVDDLRAAGFGGANVTVPFKLDAFAYANEESSAARWAGAANTLVFGESVLADNTDGFGLVRDLTFNLKTPLKDARVLLLGAGGAARGVLQAMLLQKPACVVVKNRSLDKAQNWLAEVKQASDFPEIANGVEVGVASWIEDSASTQRFDVVINATASGLGDGFTLPTGVEFADDALAYDMMYGKLTPFLQWAMAADVRRADGWGMLVEQAAKSFEIWHGVSPDTGDLIASKGQ